MGRGSLTARLPGHLLLRPGVRQARAELGRRARLCEGHVRQARHPTGRAEVPRRCGRAIRLWVVYHNIRKDLEKLGVIFMDTDTALKEHPDIVKQYFGTVIPANDNKMAALNTAVWSGGSFVYVPKGVKVEIPLQAYFRINSENMGQFERTLIIAEEGSSVH